MDLSTPQSGHSDHKLRKLSARARTASTVLKALSHHNRLLILYLLTERERTVGELEELLGVQQAMVSQQLARLRMEGLVSSRRDGRLIYYRIAKADTVTFLRSLFVMFPESEED